MSEGGLSLPFSELITILVFYYKKGILASWSTSFPVHAVRVALSNCSTVVNRFGFSKPLPIPSISVSTVLGRGLSVRTSGVPVSSSFAGLHGFRHFSTTSGSTASLSLPPSAERRADVLSLVRSTVSKRSDAFYVVDLGEVASRLHEWNSQLPRVKPFYAVKCNDDPFIVRTLASLGTGFDCATKGEMSMVLSEGVSPDRIIFAHPAKQVSHIKYALQKGVTKMTFDNEDELRKIVAHHPSAECILRILTDDSGSPVQLGLKFGAPLHSIPRILSVARSLNANVIGISYHVGSGNGTASAFSDAVRDARTAFDIASEFGYDFKFLDIGGGFPGGTAGVDPAEGSPQTDKAVMMASEVIFSGKDSFDHAPCFRTIAANIRTALDYYFPASLGVNIISEPGRFFVRSTHTLAVNVIAKRSTIDTSAEVPRTRFNYYVNEGLYGSFNCVMYDHVTPYPELCIPADAVEAARVTHSTVDPSRIVPLGAIRAEGLIQHAQSVLKSRSSRIRASVAVGGGGYASDEIVTGNDEIANSRSDSSTDSDGIISAPQELPCIGTATTAPRYVPVTGSSFGSLFSTTLWGPTCDSIDKITETAIMPELSIGDWLVFENMGAYTIAGSCKFNGFPMTGKIYKMLDGTIHVQNEEVTA